MEVKPGYKQTVVGVIPEEWEVKTLGELGQWKGGMTPSMGNPNFWLNGTVPWISSGDVKSVQLKETGHSITSEAVKQRTTTMLPAGSIILVTRSGILRKYLPVATNVIPMAINQDIKALIPDGEISASFVLHVLTERGPRILSRCMKAGTTVESVEFKWLKAFAITVPPLPEQRAIARALSDVDGLLGGLDRLIAKKRDLKQAAMQQLLTGQIRLPCFHGEWAVKTLVDLAKRKKEFFDDGDWIESEHITTEGIRLIQTGNIGVGRYVEKEPKKYIYEASFTSLQCKLLRQGDLLICRLADPAGRACVLPDIGDERVVTSVGVTIFRPPPEVANRLFLSNVFSTPEWFRAVSDRSGGTTHKRISRGALGRLSIKLPPFPEQTAIAEVLTDMDAELAALEQRREKTRALKQAMMQELLIGTTRLISPEETHA